MNAAVFINEPDTAKATARDEPGFDFQKEIGPIFSGWEKDVQTLLKVRGMIISFVALLEVACRTWRIL